MAPELLALMIPITAIVLGVGVAFWSIYWDHQKKRLQYQERQLMIEKGLTPPPVLPEEAKRVTPEDSLRRGLVLLFLGVGFGVGYVVLSRPGVEGPPAWLAGMAGAVVGFLGLGYLTYYFVVRRSSEQKADTTGIPL